MFQPNKTACILAVSLAMTAGRTTPTGAQQIVTLPTSGEESARPTPAENDVKQQADEAEEVAADVEASFQYEARALSRAFRHAAREATPSVVTVYSYGQNAEGRQRQKTSDSPEEEPDAENLPPEEEPLGPTPPPQSAEEGYRLTGLGSGVIVDLMPESTAPKTTEATKNIEPAEGTDGEETTDGSGQTQLKTYWVLTNDHVIAAARRVVVQLPDESELVAENVYGDVDSDIAVLKIVSDRDLAKATLGDSDRLEIGDWVLAIGSPFKLEATVCAGIISAKNRSLDKIRRGRLFQTDAAINPGNSGGPLVDLDGDVIAISTAIATRNGGYQGIGFAIPVNQAKWIARELAKFERVRRAAMGVRLTELNPKLAKQLQHPAYLGVLVYQVIKDSAADVAGLKNLDVILEFAGQRVRKMSALQQAVEQQPIGSTQDVKILRDGKEMMKQITLAPLEDPTATTPATEQ